MVEIKKEKIEKLPQITEDFIANFINKPTTWREKVEWGNFNEFLDEYIEIMRELTQGRYPSYYTVSHVSDIGVRRGKLPDSPYVCNPISYRWHIIERLLNPISIIGKNCPAIKHGKFNETFFDEFTTKISTKSREDFEKTLFHLLDEYNKTRKDWKEWIHVWKRGTNSIKPSILDGTPPTRLLEKIAEIEGVKEIYYFHIYSTSEVNQRYLGDIVVKAIMLELPLYIRHQNAGLPLGLSTYFDLTELTEMKVDLKNREVLFFS